MKEIAIIGHGGHSRVIRDIAILNDYKIKGYYDDKFDSDSLGPIRTMDPLRPWIVCAIGDIGVRRRIIKQPGAWVSLIHPSSIIAGSVNIEIGSVICAGAIIQPNTRIGEHCIINTRASIDHDCKIGDNCHIAPGTTICGNVQIGDNVFIGAGSTVINDIKIGDNVVIGAHSLVNKNIEDGVRAWGIPAKIQ